MELRKKIRAPKRYEPEISDAPYESRYIPSGDSKPLFHPPFIEYNPHLPPAAFPTLDSPVPAKSDRHRERSLGKDAEKDVQPHDVGNSTPLDIGEMSSTASTLITESRSGTPDVMLPKMVRSNPSNRLLSRASQHNSAIFPQSSFMTSEEMIDSAMETSDEETRSGDERQELSAVIELQTPNHDNSRIAWKDLSAAHQLRIIDSLEETGIAHEEAWLRLRLTYPEIAEVKALEAFRQKCWHQEDAQIRAHIEQVQRLLLGDADNNTRKISQAKFHNIWQENHTGLVDPDQLGVNQTTRRDLARARIFLKTLGLPQSLAGQWEEASSGSEPNRPAMRKALPMVNISDQVNETVTFSEPLHSMSATSTSRKVSSNSRKGPGSEKNSANMATPQPPPLQIRSEIRPKSSPIAQRKRKSLPPSSLARSTVPDAQERTVENGARPNSGYDNTLTAPSRNLNATKEVSRPGNDQAATALSLAASRISSPMQITYTGTAWPSQFPSTSLEAPRAVQNVQSNMSDIKNQASGSSAVSASITDILDRMRVDSMKHDGRHKSKSKEDGHGLMSSPSKQKNFRGLSLQLSRGNRTTSVQHPRKANLVGSAGSPSPRATAANRGSRDQASSGSPETVQGRSGSSREARSPAAMQLPARYRDTVPDSPRRTCPAEMRAYSASMATWSASHVKDHTDRALEKEAEERQPVVADDKHKQNRGHTVVAEHENQKPPKRKRAIVESPVLPTPIASSDAGAISGSRRESSNSLGTGHHNDSRKPSATSMETDGQNRATLHNSGQRLELGTPDPLSSEPTADARGEAVRLRGSSVKKTPSGRGRGRPRKTPK